MKTKNTEANLRRLLAPTDPAAVHLVVFIQQWVYHHPTVELGRTSCHSKAPYPDVPGAWARCGQCCT